MSSKLAGSEGGLSKKNCQTQELFEERSTFEKQR